MLYDGIIHRDFHPITVGLLVFALLFYLLNVQIYLKRYFKFTNKEAVNTKLSFREARGLLKQNTHQEKNPIDIFKTHLRLYENENTLIIQKGRQGLCRFG
jgi:hypothetical protein